ncbi:MAG: CBS domain-containing protein [bacterium]
MALEQVKEIMLPLDDYAVVSENATMMDALEALEAAQKKLPPGRQPHRAILVVNADGHIIGKVGHLAFLRGLEPKYGKIGDLGILSQVGLSSDFINSMMDNLNLWKESFADYVARAKTTKVKDIMHSVEESISEEAPFSEAIHKIIMYQTLSLLVTRKDKVVGILRLSDLFTYITEYLKKSAKKS